MGRFLALLALFAILCGGLAATVGCSDDNNSSPTTPTGIPNVAGTWTGQYHIKACTDTVNGSPGTVCASVTGAAPGTTPASTQPLQLTLTQQNDQVGGTLAFTGWYVQNVPVSGTIGTSGRLWLQGALTSTDPACPTTTVKLTLSGWITDLNRERNEMIGVFSFTGNKRLSACLFADLNVQADAVDITRKQTASTSAGAGS